MATADLRRPPAPKPLHDPFPRPWSAIDFDRMRGLGLFAGRDVFLLGDTVMESGPADARPFIFTREEYYALGDANLFVDQRVELIGGVIVQEGYVTPRRATGVQLTYHSLRVVFAIGHCVRVRLPLGLGLTSEPHPDVAVVTGGARDYIAEHPKSALLVVEVSDATLEGDTHKKASLYAAGGVADYWVIDVSGRVLVFRDPKPDAAAAFGFAYARVSAHGRDDTITPLAAPIARFAVSELLP